MPPLHLVPSIAPVVSHLPGAVDQLLLAEELLPAGEAEVGGLKGGHGGEGLEGRGGKKRAGEGAENDP